MDKNSNNIAEDKTLAGKIIIGRISGAFGIKGEVKLYHYSGNGERLSVLTSLCFILDEKEYEYEIENFRVQKKSPIIKLKGISDRDSAESLVGAEVYVEKELLRPVEEDSYFVDELIGLDVIENKLKIGVVNDIIDNPAHEIVEISTPNGMILLPMVDSFVKSINLETSEMEVELPEGILGK